MEGRKVPGFEIFVDYLDKKSMDEPILEELILDKGVIDAALELATGKNDVAEKAVDATAEKDSKWKGIFLIMRVKK